MHTPQRLFGILVALLAAAPAFARGARATESTAPAALDEAAVDRMIDLNKKAYADLVERHYQAAKYRLTEALVISETAGLENDEMTARTYVHLAVVALTGLKDRDEAVQMFLLALAIDPNITITAGLESPALKSAYLQAREQGGLPPSPDPTAPLLPQAARAAETTAGPAESAATGTQGAAEATGAAAIRDPDLPARVPSPLYCPLPFDIPPEQDFVVRCLTQKQQRKASGTFYFRPQGDQQGFVALPMERSPKGWLTAIVPGSAIQGKALPYYVKAQIPGSQEAFYLGHPEAPNDLIIRSLPNPDSAEDVAEESGPDTVAVKAAPASAEIPRPNRLRVPGSFWFSLGGGTGAAYHGRATVDSNAKVPGTTSPVTVRAGFSWAALFQIEPELGYQVSRRLSVSVMGRYQYAPEDSDGYTPQPGERAIPTSALAGFVRAQFAFMSRGPFQTYASGGAGLGTSFLAVADRHCGPTSCTLDHDDTLHGGPVALTAGLGALFHLDPSVAVYVEVKEIATLPTVMALTEVNVGMAFAHKFPKANEQKPASSTSHVSWR